MTAIRILAHFTLTIASDILMTVACLRNTRLVNETTYMPWLISKINPFGIQLYVFFIIFIHQVEYFSFDDGNWLQTQANNTKVKVGGLSLNSNTKRFHGSISCLQLYNVALNEAEVINKSKCQDLPDSAKSSPCPEDFISYQHKCIKVIFILL